MHYILVLSVNITDTVERIKAVSPVKGSMVFRRLVDFISRRPTNEGIIFVPWEEGKEPSLGVLQAGVNGYISYYDGWRIESIGTDVALYGEDEALYKSWPFNSFVSKRLLACDNYPLRGDLVLVKDLGEGRSGPMSLEEANETLASMALLTPSFENRRKQDTLNTALGEKESAEKTEQS